MQRAWNFITAALLCASHAQADDVLPTLTLQADPSGNGAKLKAGFDVHVSKAGEPISRIISPFFEGSTDNGIADLFTISPKGVSTSSNWNMGALISFLHWPTPTDDDRKASGNGSEYQPLISSAFQACSKYCDNSGTKQLAKPFCERRDELREQLVAQATINSELDPILTRLLSDTKESEEAADLADKAVTWTADADRAAATERAKELRAQAKKWRAAANRALDDRVVFGVSIGEICPTQRTALDNYLNAHYDAWSSIPTNVFQVGLSVGATANKYLAPGAGDELTLRNGTHSSQAVGAMLIHTIPHWALEVPLVAKRKFRLATTDTAKWCVPAGQVIGEEGMASNAETCNEQPIGPLGRHYSVDVAAFVSRLSPSNFWRIGLGPVLSFSPKAGDESHSSYRIGAVMPLYIGTNLLKKDLKGLARVSLGAFMSRDSTGKTDCSLTVNIAILATSTLFPSVFDQF
jgi:hypothetical protein